MEAPARHSSFWKPRGPLKKPNFSKPWRPRVPCAALHTISLAEYYEIRTRVLFVVSIPILGAAGLHISNRPKPTGFPTLPFSTDDQQFLALHLITPGSQQAPPTIQFRDFTPPGRQLAPRLEEDGPIATGK